MTSNTLAVATVGLPAKESSYYISVFALTPKDTTTETASTEPFQTVPLVSPMIIWIPFILFFLLFTVSFGLLIINKVWNWKRSVGAMVLALCLAGIPFVVSAIKQGVVTQYQAGSSEYPRRVKVMPKPPDSVIVSWDTDIPTVGAVRLGQSPLIMETAMVFIADNGQKIAKHTVVAENIRSGSVVELEIFSGTRWYNDGGKPLRFSAALK